jgi:hypothetical protein
MIKRSLALEHILYNALEDAKARNVQLSSFEDNHTFSMSREKISQTICDWVKRRIEY